MKFVRVPLDLYDYLAIVVFAILFLSCFCD